MGTGFQSTFVISWSQTELDGHWSAPPSQVRAGMSWSWTGEAVRVDGPAGVLPLGEATGVTELRQHAAQGVRRLLRAVAADTRRIDRIEVDQPLFERGFTVTDGRRTWTLTVVEDTAGRPPLLMLLGDPPPRQMDLWVVNHNLETGSGQRSGDAPGGMICFTPGTMIQTESGPLPVEEIAQGTRVQTKDNGCDEVLWVGRRRITGARLYVMPHLAPIRLREGALDKRVPDAGLLVSPDHRLVLRGPRARTLFNTDEVLVAARDLVNDATIHVDRAVRELTYFHLLLPRHQIVYANGVETESFHPASAAIDDMTEGQRRELFDRLPGASADPQSYGDYARRVLSTSETAILRHDFAA